MTRLSISSLSLAVYIAPPKNDSTIAERDLERRSILSLYRFVELEASGMLSYLRTMKMKTSNSFAVQLLFIILVSIPARSETFVGSYANWHVQTFKENKVKVCVMWSRPIKSEGNYTRRGDVYVYVTQNPREKRVDEISLTIGYPFKEKSILNVVIGGIAFKMFSEGNTAWNRKRSDDKKMIKSMQAGLEMIVRGTSRRGNDTKDTFSLKGFTKAYAKMQRSCSVTKLKR